MFPITPKKVENATLKIMLQSIKKKIPEILSCRCHKHTELCFTHMYASIKCADFEISITEHGRVVGSENQNYIFSENY